MDSARTLLLTPIGYAETPFNAKYDAPHQPGGHSSAVIGTITLLPGNNFEQALEDLRGMEKIWLIYWFDRNENWKPMVQVPRGERKKRGLFATRSPHRPNPIGLSLVDLVEVRGLTVTVANIDLLNGTPILDIKPYLPYLEAHPLAKAGWIDHAQRSHATTEYDVQWSNVAREQAAFLESFGLHIGPHADRILSRDPHPHPYRRTARCGDGYLMAYRAWRVYYRIEERVVTIDRITSGYSSEQIESASESDLSDGVAQRAFHKRWPGGD